MKRKLIIFTTLILLMFSIFTGCGVVSNKQIVDTVYYFDYAIIHLPDDSVVEGEVTSWKDFEDGDQIQVNINGTTYLVHSTNIVLINNKN